MSTSVTSDLGDWLLELLPKDDCNLDGVKVTDPLLQKLYRIFLLYSERSWVGGERSRIKSDFWIHDDEVRRFCQLLNHHLPMKHPDSGQILMQFCDLDGLLVRSSPSTSGSTTGHSFRGFLCVLARTFPYSRLEFLSAIIIVYDALINQVFKKGFLLWSHRKPGGLFHVWRRRWAVVRPKLITFYENSSEEKKLKDVFLDDSLTTESMPIDHSEPCPLFKFCLKFSDGRRRYVASSDVLLRRQWMAALLCAATVRPTTPAGNTHRLAFLRRRRTRLSSRQSKQLASLPVADSSDAVRPVAGQDPTTNNAQSSSNADRPTRPECGELQRLTIENKLLREELERQKLAVKDEEIVRGLATRLLADEKSKCDALQELNRLQSQQIDAERRRRQELEQCKIWHLGELERLKSQQLKNQSWPSKRDKIHCRQLSF